MGIFCRDHLEEGISSEFVLFLPKEITPCHSAISSEIDGVPVATKITASDPGFYITVSGHDLGSSSLKVRCGRVDRLPWAREGRFAHYQEEWSMDGMLESCYDVVWEVAEIDRSLVKLRRRTLNASGDLVDESIVEWNLNWNADTALPPFFMEPGTAAGDTLSWTYRPIAKIEDSSAEWGSRGAWFVELPGNGSFAIFDRATGVLLSLSVSDPFGSGESLRCRLVETNIFPRSARLDGWFLVMIVLLVVLAIGAAHSISTYWSS